MEKFTPQTIQEMLTFYKPRRSLIESLEQDAREYSDGVIKPPELVKKTMPKMTKNPFDLLLSGPSEQDKDTNTED
jgi:hypothetical protein